jgi:alpha-galactosidase
VSAKEKQGEPLSPAREVEIRFSAEDHRTTRYVSGRVVFDESFRDGRLVSRYWSPCGQVWPETYVGGIHWPADRPADTFIVGIDGRDLAGSYSWAGGEVQPDPSGYRADGGTVVHGVVTLLHEAKNVRVKVHTRLDGSAFLIRWLEISNLSGAAVGITAACPFAGMLWNHRYDEHLPPDCDSPFEIAYNHLFDWGQEGDFWFEPLRDGVRTVNGNKRGRSGHGRPAFWARDRCTGQTVVCELAWGGNYEFALDCRLHEQGGISKRRPPAPKAELFFRIGLSGHDPVLRVLPPGETVTTPAAHLALFQHPFDAVVQATHDHVRRVVMPEQVPGRHVEIEANHRGYLRNRENEPDLKRDIDVAASIGAEMYVIDAGWFGNDPNYWSPNVGDWFAGSWLPNGLEAIVEHAKRKGMKFGLWAEIEAAGENSTLRKERPDWLYRRDDRPVAGGRALDLSQPCVAEWVESEIARMIRQYGLDMYRLDHNHHLCPSGNRWFEGYTEDLTWRYYDNLYAVFDRLRAKFPDVVFQNCASGGGRLDWGTMHRFHNTEASDWMRFPRGLRILYGLSMSLPPEIMLRTFGTETGEHDLDGDVDTQLRVICLCRPIFRGIAPSPEELTPFLKDRIERHLDLYRTFIRPVMIEGRVFHHSGFLPLFERTPWCVLEYARPDTTAAVGAIFRTAGCGAPELVFRPRGLDPGRDYSVTSDNSGLRFVAAGHALIRDGVLVRLEQPHSSELLMFREAPKER